MIRMIQSSSAGEAKSYFSDALSKSDYFINDQELHGTFLGKLAERLNINGPATKDDFFALCENVNPATGKPLTPRTKAARRVGYDINFHAPKSVSVIHALSNDTKIMKAFQKSVTATMEDIEADSKTRVRQGDSYGDRETSELVWADFTHQTARPVEGFAPDPHLHNHCFVFNATWDETEKKIKAGQFGDIKRDMPYYQARFHKHLSDGLIDLGYEIKRTASSFEIVGVPQGIIDIFSKRTNEIGQIAKEKGITDAKELSELGARTRAKKQKGLSMEELRTEWRSQIRQSDGFETMDMDAPLQKIRTIEPGFEKAHDCIDFALKHSFERVSVKAERRILETAYRDSIGKRSISLAGITTAFKNDERIIHVKEKFLTYCTTKSVLWEERRMVELARFGQNKCLPMYGQAPDYRMVIGQQADAVTHLLTTPHRVSIIRGRAGTGKTTLMSEAIPLMEAAGKKVMVVAPTAEASRGVLAQEGFKDANTVAGLLQSEKRQEELKGGVLWVDEAGLLGTKDMTALLALVEKQNARLILGGDTRQHASVVRGDALRLLNTVGAIHTAEVSVIRRQKDANYRQVVENLSEGNIKEGFERLDEMGSIRDIDPLKPNSELVTDYMQAVKAGKTTLVIAPTHKQGQAITTELRDILKKDGLLGKKELKAVKLQNLNLTEAQKSDYRNFKKGQMIRFNQNLPGVKRGSLWSVSETTGKDVQIISAEGKSQTLPYEKAGSFDIYLKNEIALSKGDKIKITRNSFDEQKKRLNNGQSLRVMSVSKSGRISLQNEASKETYELNKDFGDIDHAYCSTSHSSQGKTVDEVFISQPAATFGATDAKQFYVSVSRGRDAVTIYTDDRAALLQHASEMGDRRSALELVNYYKEHEQMAVQVERAVEQEKEANAIKLTQEQYREQVKEMGYEPEL